MQFNNIYFACLLKDLLFIFKYLRIEIILSPFIRILPWQPFKTLIMGFKLESLVFCTQ